jgi:hypothetical protein
MGKSYRKGTGTKNKETYHIVTAEEAFLKQGNIHLANMIRVFNKKDGRTIKHTAKVDPTKTLYKQGENYHGL